MIEGVRSGVAGLRLTAADVATLRTQTEIVVTPTLLAPGPSWCSDARRDVRAPDGLRGGCQLKLR